MPTNKTHTSRNRDLRTAPLPSIRRRRPDNCSSTSAFENATNTRIKNSSLIVNNIQTPENTSEILNKLYDRVASNAILNAGGRADEVKCYPGTREEVIGLMERWMDEEGAPSMMWLSGPAGAGKSAIVQTIAERCKDRGVQAASFFFFRGDSTRSTARPLVATLLFQIIELYPPARQLIATVLSDHPLIFDASIQDQFRQLLLTPLQDIPHRVESPARRSIVLLIDGLDECDSERKTPQRQILQALEHLVMQKDSLFLALVASRAEPHITMAIKELASPVQSIFLDGQYQPEKDIEAFVTGEFNRIKKSHHLAQTLSNWPPDEDTEFIVKKSSGQFIYAATVMRYIANSSASPKHSLKTVKGIAAVATNSPFAHLDAVYTYIFSQVDGREVVMDMLAMQLLINLFRLDRVFLMDALHAYNPRYGRELLDSCVSNLTAILQFNRGKLTFFHASLPDFLKDKSRAGEYHIDMDAFAAKILPAIWMNAQESRALTIMAIRIFNSLKTPTPEITTAFRNILPSTSLAHQYDIHTSRDLILSSIHRLYYPHDVKSYKKLMRRWVFWHVNAQPMQELPLTAKKHPYVMFYLRIAQIEHWAARTLLRKHA